MTTYTDAGDSRVKLCTAPLFTLPGHVSVAVSGIAATERITLDAETAAALGRELLGAKEPAPFKANAHFEDIQAGDLIQYRKCEGRGVSVIREGVAHHKDLDGDWVTEEGDFLTCEGPKGATITILSRPKPALPTEPGAVILIEIDGREVAAFRDAAQQLAWWCPVVWPGTTGHWAADNDVSSLPWRLARVEAVDE